MGGMLVSWFNLFLAADAFITSVIAQKTNFMKLPIKTRMVLVYNAARTAVL